MAQGAAGGELGQEIEGVAEELQGAQVAQRAQVNDRGRQPVALQGQLPQLAAVPDLACSIGRYISGHGVQLRFLDALLIALQVHPRSWLQCRILPARGSTDLIHGVHFDLQ